MVDCDSVTLSMDKESLGIARLTDLNIALIVKWVFCYTNERNSLRR